MKAKIIGVTAIAVVVVVSSLAADGARMKVTSSAFQQGGNIPSKFTCDGANANPPLHLDQAPAGTKSLALIVDDPDAPGGTFVHWVVWNIDPKTTNIGEHSAPPNSVQGKTGFGNSGYGGPCPPSGTHRYYFRVYALDVPQLQGGLSRADLERAMQGHIIGQGELMGRYSKK
jgi:Raf kinase inhibitor-like YbhB/YbcL family protein